jgi:hypothetical protein
MYTHFGKWNGTLSDCAEAIGQLNAVSWIVLLYTVKLVEKRFCNSKREVSRLAYTEE